MDNIRQTLKELEILVGEPIGWNISVKHDDVTGGLHYTATPIKEQPEEEEKSEWHKQQVAEIKARLNIN